MNQELYNILTKQNVTKSIYNNINIILKIIPELENIIGFEHKHPHHHLNVWDHTMLALSISPNDFNIRLALLLHDIGKPYSYQDEKVRHFKGHAEVSSKMAFNILKRLNFGEKEIFELCYLIENHDTQITEEDINNDKELAIKRFKIQVCDALAHNPSKLEKRIKYLILVNKKINNGEEKEKYKILINSFKK